MDAAEPPRIVFESPAQCRESDRAEELLRRGLTLARAPGPGWSVAMRVDPAAKKGLRAEAEITDGDGVAVGRRTIEGTTAGCGALARAVGVWASLVLDGELRRARRPGSARAEAMGAGGGVASAMASGSAAGGALGSGGSGGGASGAGTGDADGAGTGDAPSGVGMGAAATEPAGAWPAPAVTEKPSPEHDWYLHHDEGRSLELGAGMFLATGTGSGAVAGPTAFVVIEAGHGLFLRPAVAFGESLTSLPPSDVKASTWTAARFDTCVRMPGLYTRHHGMQLDLCGGTDVGVTTIDGGARSTLPYWDIGPSLDLRGELGSRLSAVLRAVAGINVLRESFTDNSHNAVDVPIVAGRLELAFSWDVR